MVEVWLNFVASPWPVVALTFAIFLFFGTLIIALDVIEEKGKISRSKAYWAGRKQNKNGTSTRADFAADQLKKVSEARFVARALLNAPEAKVFAALDSAVIARNPRWQVMAQVSLGEFLASPDKDAYFAVNSKRVDFALMDENCRVVHALEYQGSGHHTCASAAATRRGEKGSVAQGRNRLSRDCRRPHHAERIADAGGETGGASAEPVIAPPPTPPASGRGARVRSGAKMADRPPAKPQARLVAAGWVRRALGSALETISQRNRLPIARSQVSC